MKLKSKSPYPKVLLACPVSDYKDYIIWRWIDYIKTLTYPNYQVFLCDNSRNSIYYQKIKKKGIECYHVNPEGKDNRLYMMECNEKIRNIAIGRNYDYLFSLECDIFPPATIIEQLMVHQKPVVNACYYIGLHRNRTLMVQKLEKTVQYTMVRNFTLRESFDFIRGDLQRVYGCGIGCSLISRNVFGKIPFRVDLNGIGHADSWFYQDLAMKNIPVYLDTSIVCRHFNNDWTKINEYEQRKLESSKP